MTMEDTLSIVIQERETVIQGLERRLAEKEAIIQDLLSKLDKYKSILPFAGNAPGDGHQSDGHTGASDRKNQRAWGISAEPSSKIQLTVPHCTIKRASIEKSDKTRELIRIAITDDDFLQNLDSVQVREIIECTYPVDLKPDSVVIYEGDIGSILYVVEEGQLEVTKAGQRLTILGPGKAFGELAILYNCTRTATVTSLTTCRLWAIERTSFQTIMMRTGIERRKLYTEFLSSVPVFESLSPEMIYSVADVLDEVHYDNGSYIVRQYARGDTFYIIAKGRVKVTRTEPGQHGETYLRTLTAGDFFGERALESEDVRTANIIAYDREGVNCLVLERDAYMRLISKIDALHRTYEEPNDTEVKLDIPRELVDVPLRSFTTIATLGVGGFGRVELVKVGGDTSRSYAMKKMKKQHIVETRQQEHVLNEKNIMSQTRSDFIVRLYKTYKDRKYLYMVMEPCLGGELWAVLRDKGVFDEIAARFYTACVIEALVYLHTRTIVYRDLKPENVLLDNIGYAKLVDFGFAKKIGRGWKTWTFCGTPEYVAPEVILNKGHDFSADLWSLGIFIFELLTGTPPFTQTDPLKTYNAILKGIDVVDFPRYVGKNSRNIIKNLCRENPNERLGHGAHGLSDIQKQKWYEGFNWEGVRKRTEVPPYVPKIGGATDASNFDEYPEDVKEPRDDLSNWDEEF